MCFNRYVSALVRRNLIYRKRRWFASLVQLVLPALTIGILVLIKFSLEDSESFVPRTIPASYPSNSATLQPFSFLDYVTAIGSNKTCVEASLDASYHENWDDIKDLKYHISGIDILNWPVPFVKCDASNCTEVDEDATKLCTFHILALAPSNPASKDRVKKFAEYIYATYPQLVDIEKSISSKLGHPFSLVNHTRFLSSEDIDSYVKADTYGNEANPKIALAVIIGGSSEKEYTYTIRTNSTNFNSPELAARPVQPTQPSTKSLFESFAKTPQEACALEGGTSTLGRKGIESICFVQYIYNGALAIQRLVDDWIIDVSNAKREGYFVAENGVAFANFPTREYTQNGFYAQIAPYAPLLIILGLLYPVSASIRAIVSEKELRQKELMKMMSITEASIGRAWFISTYGFLFISGILSSISTSYLYPKASKVLIWIFWELSFLAFTMYIFVIAAISARSTRATLIGILLFFSGYFFTQIADYEDGSSGLISLFSLHPAAAVSYGMQVMGSLEDAAVGVTRETLNSTDNPSGFTFQSSLRLLVTDTILWGILSWYLNRVIRGDYGQAEVWYFPCTKSYWSGSASTADLDNVQNESRESIPTEPVSAALKEQENGGNAVLIRGLTKMFGEKTAVNNLNLSMYSGQVFALLGHNGAGKTTTINMLTGMVSPTSGYATIAGKNIVSEMSSVRRNVGVCLQHDCLFPQLTVKEHIEFFSRVKGLYEEKSSSEVEAYVNAAIEDVALLEKRNTFSKDLSGGMKRKLSVAIAFCGGSKIVFLDEPTSGMDPFSRRFTWDVIRQYREDRCIILTTHFMDEADLLGDRIGIMADGQLRCVGSPLFLKKSYGVGYQLTIEKLPVSKGKLGEPQQLEDELKEIVLSNVKEGALLSNVGTELSFQLPIGSSDTFSEMFEMLDNKVDSEQIVTYGVSITTLDEVFLMVARGQTVGKTEKLSSSMVTATEPFPNNETLDKSYNSRSHELGEREMFSKHMKSLFAKRALNFKRDKKAWLCSTILPILFAFVGFAIVVFVAPSRDMPSLELKLSDYNDDIKSSEIRNPIPFNNASNFLCQPGICIGDSKIEINSETYYYCGDQAFVNPNLKCSVTGSKNISEHFQGNYSIGQEVSTIFEASKMLPNNPEVFNFPSTQYGAIYFTHDTSSLVNGSKYSDVINTTCYETPVSYGESNIANSCEHFQGIGYVVNTNFTSLHSSLLYQAMADEAIVREALGDDSFSIKAKIHPLPITKLERGFAQAEDSFSAWFLLVLSFPFITGSFATFIVQERMSKAKHLQTVAGVKPEAYWLSSYAWDIMNYQLPMWTIIVLMYILGVEGFTTSDRGINGGTIVTLIFFGPAAVGFTYCITFLFKSPSACNLFVIVFNFFIGLAGPLVTLILTILGIPDDGGTDYEGIAEIIEWFLRFIPSFNFSKALLYMLNIDLFVLVNEDPDLDVWSPSVILYEVIFLAVQSVVYVWLAIYLDKLSTNPKVVQKFNSFLSCRFSSSKGNDETPESDRIIDEDVMAETVRVREGQANDDLIVLNDLVKRYPNGKLAVNHMSLGIPAGQCFGLLGINGAGKTTTMGILTAEFPPTAGDANLASFSVKNEPERTRREIGYCPQFDAHFMNMTGREHVELYAAIKGVPGNLIGEVARSKLIEVGLNEYDSNRLSSNYSGGMKRKLSVACATIGNPQIVFLDEPSTGMDPVARRDLWKVISKMVVGNESQLETERTSVILTTHSMEECEALCPRIGIMANGKLCCLGSAQHLKSRFGKGYQIEIKIKEVSEDDVDFKETLLSFLKSDGNQESDVEIGIESEELFFNLNQVIDATRSLSGDDSLSSIINAQDPNGYVIYKSANSETGISAHELAAFCAKEIRVQLAVTFFEREYSDAILRERQDCKLRFEVSSEGRKVSSLFADMEDNKESLHLSDYGISQTSLEQVFNMHAADAEQAKHGAAD